MRVLSRLRNLLRALLMRALGAVHPAVGVLLEHKAELYRAAWKSYRAAGMPYGDSEQDMERWLREPEQAKRLRIDVEALLREKQQ